MDPKGAPWSPLGSFGVPLDDFLESLDVILGAVGCLGGPLGVPGGSWVVPGRFGSDCPGFSGKFREAFWLNFGFIFVVFSLFLFGSVF